MMSENGKKVLDFFKRHYGEEFTRAQVAEHLGISIPSAIGSVNSLVNKGILEERTETIEVEPATENKKAVINTIKYSKMTEHGLAYDPDDIEKK